MHVLLKDFVIQFYCRFLPIDQNVMIIDLDFVQIYLNISFTLLLTTDDQSIYMSRRQQKPMLTTYIGLKHHKCFYSYLSSWLLESPSSPCTTYFFIFSFFLLIFTKSNFHNLSCKNKNIYSIAFDTLLLIVHDQFICTVREVATMVTNPMIIARYSNDESKSRP